MHCRILVNVAFISFNDGDFYCFYNDSLSHKITHTCKCTYKKVDRIWMQELYSLKSIVKFLLVWW